MRLPNKVGEWTQIVFRGDIHEGISATFEHTDYTRIEFFGGSIEEVSEKICEHLVGAFWFSPERCEECGKCVE